MSVAVFDIGKTNLKLLAIDRAGAVLAQRSTPNRPQPGPPPLAGVLLAAWADCSLSMPPSVMPSIAEPPTRRMSRRVTPRPLSQTSLPA